MDSESRQTKNLIYCIIEATALYMITITITGSYLAKLTGALGFSDSLTATVTSAVVLGYAFQLLAIPLFRKGRVKNKVTALYTLSTVLFAFLYLTPFIDIAPKVRTAVFITFFLVGNFILNAVFPPITNLYMSSVPDNLRGRFTALKEGVSLVFGVVLQFTLASVIDRYEAAGNIPGALSIIAKIVIVLAIIHTLSLIYTHEEEPKPKEHQPLFKELKGMFHDKTILCVILLGVLWSVTYNMSQSFYGTYLIKELGFSMTFIAVMSVFSAVARISASVLLGKYADKKSFAKMLIICYILIGGAFLSMMLATPANRFVTYPIYVVLSAAAFGGINSAEINIVFDYVSPEKRMNVISIKQTLYGLCGFLSTVACTPLVNYIQKSGNKLFGFNVYAQQVLSAMSTVMIVILIVYVNKIILKLKRNS